MGKRKQKDHNRIPECFIFQLRKKKSAPAISIMWARGLYSIPFHTDKRQLAHSLQDQAFTQVSTQLYNYQTMSIFHYNLTIKINVITDMQQNTKC